MQGFANGPRDLGHFQRVGQAGPVIVPLVVNEYLGFVFQLAEGRTMDDAVAIPLEAGAIGVLLLPITTPPTLTTFNCTWGKRAVLQLFDVPAIDQDKGSKKCGFINKGEVNRTGTGSMATDLQSPF